MMMLNQPRQRRLTKKGLWRGLSHCLNHSEHGRQRPFDSVTLQTTTQCFIFIFHQRVVKLEKGGKQDEAHVDWGGQRCQREEKYQQEETDKDIHQHLQEGVELLWGDDTLSWGTLGFF